MTKISTEELERIVSDKEPAGPAVVAMARELLAARKVVEAARLDLKARPKHFIEGTDLAATLTEYDEATQ